MWTFAELLGRAKPQPEPVASFEERVGQCQTCVHRDEASPGKCKAFPEGIPIAILVGFFDHTHPYLERGEVADKGIRYQPRTP